MTAVEAVSSTVPATHEVLSSGDTARDIDTVEWNCDESIREHGAMFFQALKRIAGRLLTADRRPTALAVPFVPELTAVTPHDWRLFMVADVHRARAILGQKQIPVVFCDRDIPNASWKEAVRILAAAPCKPCVVLLSSSMSPELWEQITESGGYDVLRKPVTSEDFLRVLRAGLCHWRSSLRLQMMCGMPLHR